MDHAQHAVEVFHKGYNCAQTVFAAFRDETEMDFDAAVKQASSFGGGMGGLREVCGAVSGMFMTVGMICGYTDPKEEEAKAYQYEQIQALAEKFKAEQKSIICRELLEMRDLEPKKEPEPRTEEYYEKRPCSEFIECAARLTEEWIAAEKKEESIRNA